MNARACSQIRNLILVVLDVNGTYGVAVDILHIVCIPFMPGQNSIKFHKKAQAHTHLLQITIQVASASSFVHRPAFKETYPILFTQAHTNTRIIAHQITQLLNSAHTRLCIYFHFNFRQRTNCCCIQFYFIK